ncbi:hypothetical protein, partial [Nocardia sp. GTS18]|uniref:hypothetical protein n=1 Tax=Nocardia sp. GTS18 TaxID=1778064 RepID=UPI0015EE84A6
MPPTPPSGSPESGDNDQARSGDPLRDVAEFLREQRDLPGQRDAAPLSEDAASYARALGEALGLGERFSGLRQPLAALAELAELARARGFLDSADGPAMRYPADFGPLSDTDLYGDEQYWLTEADDATLRAVQEDLRRAGLPVDQPSMPTRQIPPQGSPILASNPTGPAARVPDSDPNHAADHVPTPESVDQTRDRLVRRFDLSDADLAHLGDTVAHLRYRNLLRAAMVEAMAAAVDRVAGISGPTLRAQAEGARDGWARRLRVDPDTLVRDPDRAIADARAEVRREADDILDLADAVRVTEGGDNPDGSRRYNIQVDGDRVPARLVPDGDSRWRVEESERLDPPAGIAVGHEPRGYAISVDLDV